jgi:hypothetical protein
VRNAAPVPGADRGSRVSRSPQGRLRGLPSRRAARARLFATVRAEPRDQGARPDDAGPVPRMRSAGASRCFDQVGAPGRTRGVVSGTSERARGRLREYASGT